MAERQRGLQMSQLGAPQWRTVELIDVLEFGMALVEAWLPTILQKQVLQ